MMDLIISKIISHNHKVKMHSIILEDLVSSNSKNLILLVTLINLGLNLPNRHNKINLEIPSMILDSNSKNSK